MPSASSDGSAGRCSQPATSSRQRATAVAPACSPAVASQRSSIRCVQRRRTATSNSCHGNSACSHTAPHIQAGSRPRRCATSCASIARSESPPSSVTRAGRQISGRSRPNAIGVRIRSLRLSCGDCCRPARRATSAAVVSTREQDSGRRSASRRPNRHCTRNNQPRPSSIAIAASATINSSVDSPAPSDVAGEGGDHVVSDASGSVSSGAIAASAPATTDGASNDRGLHGLPSTVHCTVALTSPAHSDQRSRVSCRAGARRPSATEIVNALASAIVECSANVSSQPPSGAKSRPFMASPCAASVRRQRPAGAGRRARRVRSRRRAAGD